MFYNILVTGGAGFIGSNFIESILCNETFKKGYNINRVVNVDKLTYAGNLDNTRKFANHPSYMFVQGDIKDYDLMSRIIKDCEIDLIVNFAAESHVDNSIKDSSPFYESNVLGVVNLLNIIKENKSVTRMVQISTDEVYGQILEGSFSEEDVLDPSSPYSSSKAAADLACLSYYRTFGVPVVITRSVNNYGPHQHSEKFIPTIINCLYSGKQIPVYGDGLNVREWIHVEDNCRAIWDVAYRGEVGEVYNIGSTISKYNMQVIFDIAKIMGRTEVSVKFIADRLGHDRRYSVKYDKIQKIGYRDAVPYDVGMKGLILYYDQLFSEAKETTGDKV